MKPETVFKIRVAKDLSKIPNCWFFKTQERTLRGIPDFILCLNGHFIAIELKVGKNQVTVLQDFILKQVAKSNGLGFVVYPNNWGPTYATLQALSNSG